MPRKQFQIRARVDDSQIQGAIDFLEKKLTGDYMFQILGGEAAEVWIPNIIERLDKSAARTNWRDEADKKMVDLNEEAAIQMNNTKFFYLNEFQRRGSDARMGITDKIAQSIINNIGYHKSPGILAIGIGDIEKLSGLTELEDGYYLWELLEYGTGIYTAGGMYSAGYPITRDRTQVFWDRRPDQQVPRMTRQTINPGQRGRHYFMTINGDFYDRELTSALRLFNEMKLIVDIANRTQFTGVQTF